MNKSSHACLAISVLLISACSQETPSETPASKPKHIWSSQVETLHQAREVASFANEQQKLQEQRLREAGAGEPQR